MYIPEKRQNHQITFFDFNQSYGMEANEYILETSGATKEHAAKNESRK